MPKNAIPAYITSLIRHFEDLRDGTHGGSASQKDKEAHFEKAVQLLAPIAHQVLTEINARLLLDTGQLADAILKGTVGAGFLRREKGFPELSLPKTPFWLNLLSLG
jgi:hypothetical protein